MGAPVQEEPSTKAEVTDAIKDDICIYHSKGSTRMLWTWERIITHRLHPIMTTTGMIMIVIVAIRIGTEGGTTMEIVIAAYLPSVVIVVIQGIEVLGIATW